MGSKIPSWRALSYVECKAPRFTGALQDSIWLEGSKNSWSVTATSLIGLMTWLHTKNDYDLAGEIQFLIEIARIRAKGE